jgi:hypothetical protein
VFFGSRGVLRGEDQFVKGKKWRGNFISLSRITIDFYDFFNDSGAG